MALPAEATRIFGTLIYTLVGLVIAELVILAISKKNKWTKTKRQGWSLVALIVLVGFFLLRMMR